MMRVLTFATAASFVVMGSAVFAQAKPVTRSDYVNSLNARFSSMDTNHDGVVTSAELGAEQQKEMQQAKANLNQQLTAKFRQLDTNKDGSLSLQEFLAASPSIRGAETPDQILQKLDTNKDGKVSAEEFRAPQLAAFNKADTNHDGVVTPAEAQAAGRK